MHITYYHIDAFTNKIFSGNPAAVCVLPTRLPDNTLNAIAKENNLPVTAFLVRTENSFAIRWITPEYELDICGHGTLAAAYVIFTYLEPTWTQVDLQARLETLTVTRTDDLITLNFPAKTIESCDYSLLIDGLGLQPSAIYQHQYERCFAVYETQEQVQSLNPNINILKQLKHRGISVTAPGNTCDFVSRTFYPQKQITEDAVTGASQCLLVPYWANRLDKTKFHTLQLSARGGEMFCEYQYNRVLISGRAVTYFQGEMRR